MDLFKKILFVFLVGYSAASISQVCDFNVLKTTPLARFSDNNDGTVTDKWTMLMWKQCVEGTFSDGANGCSADPVLSLNWQDSLNRAVVVNDSSKLNLDYKDWRLPNAKELESIVERHCEDPAINLILFPNVKGGRFGLQRLIIIQHQACGLLILLTVV